MQDYFIFRDYLCIVFEILSKSLYDAVQETELGLSLDTIRNYMRQILEALVICKQSNLIHCDLKPENILITKDDGLNVKLIDFGFSTCIEKHTKVPIILLRLKFSVGLPVTWHLRSSKKKSIEARLPISGL